MRCWIKSSFKFSYHHYRIPLKNYVESKDGLATAPATRGEVFGWILSNPVTPHDLLQR